MRSATAAWPASSICQSICTIRSPPFSISQCPEKPFPVNLSLSPIESCLYHKFISYSLGPHSVYMLVGISQRPRNTFPPVNSLLPVS